MENMPFAAGETIFEQGDPSDRTYRIVAGSVDIVVLGNDGAERRIASLGPEDVFGEMGIIDPAPRSATAIAREPTVCRVYTADEVIELISSDPQQAMDIVKSLILRLRNSNRKLAAKKPPSAPKPPDTG